MKSVSLKYRIYSHLVVLFVIAGFSVQSTPAQETLPPYHWAQRYLNYFKVRGALADLNYQVRPFTRMTIAKSLLTIPWYQLRFTTTEKRQLKLLFEEFGDEIGILVTQHPDQWLYKLKRAQMFIPVSIPHLEGEVALTPGLYQEVGIKNFGETSVPIATRLRLKARWKDKIYVYHHLNLFNEADSNYPGKEFRNFYAYSEQAYIAVEGKWGRFQLGRDYFQIGPGRSSQLLFSDNSLPFDMYRGQLGRGTLRFYFWGIALNPRANQLDTRSIQPRAYRYINGHRLAIHFQQFSVAVNEVVLYGGPFQRWEMGLLNPFMIYYGYQVNTPGFAGNAFVSIDATWYPFPGIELYGTFLVDDFQVDKREPGDLEPNELGFLGGAQWSQPLGMPNVLLRAEYVQVRNRTYNAPQLDWEKYLHYNKVIGYYLGNNFERFQLGGEYWLPRNIQLTADVILIRQGEGSVQGEFNKDYLNYTVEEGYHEPFPYGVVETQWQWRTGIFWSATPWAHISASAQYTSFSNYQHQPGTSYNDWQFHVSLWFQWHKPFIFNR